MLRCRTRNYTSLVVMGSSKRKLCFRYCEMVISWPRRERRCGAAAGSRTPGRGGAVRVCRGTMPPARKTGAGGRGGKNGKRRTSVAWSDHGRPTRRTMARAVPVAPVGAVLQWERCSSGSDALVGAMLRWERCSSGSGGRSDDSVVERSTRARDRKAAVRGSRHCGRGDAGRVDLSMPLTHVPSPV